jgi:negative regulator of flagellin synthesis FlgM
MIVSNNKIQQVANVYGSQAKLSKPTKNSTSSAVSHPDEVILSASAQEFGTMMSKLQSIPDVRADKVSALNDQVATGSYHVDAYEIAAKMLAGS